MDYEKAYKSLVAKINNAHLYAQTDSTKNVLEDILPELRESEDERIRRILVEYFSPEVQLDFVRGVPIKKIRDWLEKQKEQKPIPDWMPKFLDELRSKKNYFDWDEHRDFEGHILAIIDWIAPDYFDRKEKEQKPAESIVDRRQIAFMIEDARRCGVIEGRKQVIDDPGKYGLQELED